MNCSSDSVGAMARSELSAQVRYDVVVVGAGQAGLAIGYYLQQRGSRFLIVDAGSAIGWSWAGRWDSLRLFTPARYSGLPGTPFPGAEDSYPDKTAVARYLAAYAHHHGLPIRLNTGITKVRRDRQGYVLASDAGNIHARQVVIATGPFQTANIPSVAKHLSPEVVQLHSSEYQRPADLPYGQILVVGGGNSGFQIAVELTERRSVDLAIGRRNAADPQRPLGRDLFWWQSVTGLIRVKADSRFGRRMQQGEGTVIGLSPKQLRKRGVRFRPRLTGARSRTVEFCDNTYLDVDGIVWATGFRQDHSWIDVPEAMNTDGELRQRRGVTPSPGLYVLGLPWQHTTGSALLGFVKHDAAYIAEQIASPGQSNAD